MSGFPTCIPWEQRAGAGRRSHVEEFDQAITDLARVIYVTATEDELRKEYAPVLVHLAHARRALRQQFGK